MKFLHRAVALIVCCASFALAETNKDSFLRVQKDKYQTVISLDSPIIHYYPSDKSYRVDLIGAVHIGDQAYFDRLNSEFKNYDAVLYELVIPDGFSPEMIGKKSKTKHPVSSMQTYLKDSLKLEFQLEKIDYLAKNLVHADFTAEEFANSMHEKGESMTQILLRSMAVAYQKELAKGTGLKGQDLKLLFALFSNDRSLALKRLLAEQFTGMEGMISAVDGEKGSTLIAARNDKAMEVLSFEIERGHKKLAIYYGAGHLPDMEKQLFRRFGLKRAKTEWITAWDLPS